MENGNSSASSVLIGREYFVTISHVNNSALGSSSVMCDDGTVSFQIVAVPCPCWCIAHWLLTATGASQVDKQLYPPTAKHLQTPPSQPCPKALPQKLGKGPGLNFRICCVSSLHLEWTNHVIQLHESSNPIPRPIENGTADNRLFIEVEIQTLGVLGVCIYAL